MAESGTAFVSGIFNVVHPGHMRLLRFAKELRGRLVVGVLSDDMAGAAASVGQADRLDGVRSLRFVDDAFLIDDPVSEVIASLRPDVVVKGREHAHQWNEEQQATDAYGGRIVFASGDNFIDSSDVMGGEIQALDRRSIDLPIEFMQRHGITSDRLLEILDAFPLRRVIVAGDVIADEYIACHALGMSQEDPTVVVTPVGSELFLGGAGIAAAHAAGLGAQATLHSVVGKDQTAAFVERSLHEAGVIAHLHTDESRPTTLKQRYRAAGKTLLRVSHLHQGPISDELQQEFAAPLLRQLTESDLLIFSDFNYGCLPQPLVDTIVSAAVGTPIVLAADSQSSSQVGNVGRFTGMHLLTPTEREARLSTRNSDDGLVVLADQLREAASAQLVFLTLGSDGMLIRGRDGAARPALTDRVEALNRRPVDVAGAGDSLLVAGAMALTCGATSAEAAVLGSLAAAIQVSRLGNTPLHLDDIRGVLLT